MSSNTDPIARSDLPGGGHVSARPPVWRRCLASCVQYYVLLMFVSAALILWLNYDATAPGDLHGGGDGFNAIIRSGFDRDVANAGFPTYPMWGYGWLIFLTNNKLALLLIQGSLAMGAVWFSIRCFERASALPPPALSGAKVLMAFAFPWFAFHSYIYPSSISVSLILIGFVFLYRGFTAPRPLWVWFVGSGILTGLALNFRSDYCYLPIAIAATVCWLGRFRLGMVLRSAAWFAAVLAMMLPWMLYTKHACGHYLVKSTNAGHVAFIGLGNLPCNKWGITDRDDDPLMARLIHDKFGDLPQKYPSLLYEPDQFLQQEFLKRVRADPGEYARRCLYCTWALLTNGCEYGYFWRTASYWQSKERKGDLMNESRATPLEFIKARGLSLYCRLLLARFNKAYGILLVFCSYLVFPITFLLALRRRDPLWTLVAVVIGYQSCMNIFVNDVSRYTTNIYYFLILNLAYGCWLFAAWLLRHTRLDTSVGHS